MWKSANETDLWDAVAENLTEADLPPGTSLREIMSTWTTQAGYPLISVGKTDVGEVTVSQDRYQDSNYTDRSNWIIPVSYMIGDEEGNVEKMWLTVRNVTLRNVTVGNGTWVLFNVDQTGEIVLCCTCWTYCVFKDLYISF